MQSEQKKRNDKKRLMQPAPNKRLQSGIIIPYSHLKTKGMNERRKNKGFAVFLKNAVPISPEAVICLVVLIKQGQSKAQKTNK